MSSSLVHEMMNEFRRGPLDAVASILGESPDRIQTALSGALPALAGSLANKTSTPEGATDTLELIRRSGLDSGPYGDVSDALAVPGGISKLIDTGKPLLGSVLGEHGNSITEWVSSLASIPRAAAASVLSMALPLVLGNLGRRVRSSGWNPSSLMSLMAGQPILQEAPAGLAAILGSSPSARAHRPVVHTYNREPWRGPVLISSRSETQTRVTWWKWALPLFLLGLGGYWYARRHSPPPPAALLPRIELPAAVNSPFVDMTLQNAVTLSVPADGVESRLVAFIENPNRKVDKNTWFIFDRLEFESNSATLKPSSGEQLQNIAAILKAYPEVKVKIGGYTDNVGDDSYNLKLSAERAANTMDAIAALGIHPSRLASEGYGNSNPVDDNSTEEGRQRNRRIDIRVTEK